ncbi:ATP-binding protein [Cytobacillus purgationiresistens]|uniref:histidine kinase n=1 Tax=Cytobacillus purgationiresistens TaxID=863449 RepID=A0ABU0ABU3_9BACI|nr:ATP-binding protein [Cytobacillus purgationiresistens]MDQ0268726.1 PAS domain S-box-containing protein [Cytobacillus purgationiresistens]
MNKSGQVTLVLISILFTTYQKVMSNEPFFTIDFFIFTFIAWFVGWQFDKAQYFEKKSRAGEDSYKRLIDSLPESVFILQEYKMVYVNEAAACMMGAASKEALIGKSIFEFMDPEYEGRLLERMKHAKKEQQPLNTIEYRFNRLDGSMFFYESSSLSITFGEKEAVLSIGKDITERKEQTERLLQKSEKLAILGQMAAGIAHEIRNPLTSIKGFIQLFKTSNQQEEYYDIVLSEIDRINEIVGEFLVLAKPSAAIFAEQDVKVLIKDVVTLINNQSILNNVQIYVEFDSDLPMVSCEKSQLKQVFLNLLKNSIEAMPNGGNIDVKVKEKVEGEISILIIDEGMGIPKERISTLGEPFYTTKEKGTGLGLMTCYKIIESHNGQLTIQSEVNQGTTIEIIMPTISQPLLVRG